MHDFATPNAVPSPDPPSGLPLAHQSRWQQWLTTLPLIHKLGIGLLVTELLTLALAVTGSGILRHNAQQHLALQATAELATTTTQISLTLEKWAAQPLPRANIPLLITALNAHNAGSFPSNSPQVRAALRKLQQLQSLSAAVLIGSDLKEWQIVIRIAMVILWIPKD